MPMSGGLKMRIALLLVLTVTALVGFVLGRQDVRAPAVTEIDPAPATVYLSDLHWE